jgi:hypothetical protein
MIGPDFQPSWIGEPVTQGVALGWHETGALPLNKPTRPELDAESANGAAPYQPGATPQENRTPQHSGLKARAYRDTRSAEVLSNIKALL